MGYKFITDHRRGEGTSGEYRYEWSINSEGGYSVFVSDQRGEQLAEWNSYHSVSGLQWAPMQMSKAVVGDVFVLLTDIAAEIDRRLGEQAERENLHPRVIRDARKALREAREQDEQIQRDVELRGV